MRIGNGYDVHRLVPGDGMVIGGVHISCPYGIKAHSDGDVLIHALCDALLGAAGLGDIGRYFPDTDRQWQGADSRDFLRRVHEMLAEHGLRIVNADTTVVAQVPRLAPYVDAMRAALAADLGIHAAMINVKATTSERMGFIGREEGIAAHAVVLLESDK